MASAALAMGQRYLALDYGAESGRGVVGTFDRARLTLDEVHRFPTGPVRVGSTMHWDLPLLLNEARRSLAAAHAGGPIASVGVDTWGVDFGLIGPRGELVGLPVHYRDPRTDGVVERVFGKVAGGRAAIFERTGIQTMQINTLFQLAALAEQSPRLLDAADRLLFMPDLFHYYLTGVAQSEYTIASTAQMYDSRAGGWATEFLEPLGIPARLLPPVVAPGTVYGPLTDGEAGAAAGAIPVIAPGGHDTACAVAAVPAETNSGWAYLSSGTWSLLGVEIPAPIITPATEAANFTNEGGVAGTIRLLKNIAGLWLVQECRRAYARLGDDRSYAQLTRLAADARPLATVIDPDHPSLLAPADMPAAIRALCGETGQTPPEGIGATIRCALDSLGMKYRQVLAQLEAFTGARIHTLHIVGGGSQNHLLNQIAADATGRRVLAGPVEATAIGSVLLQARALGHLQSLADLRTVVRASFPIEVFEPDASMAARWADIANARGF